MTLEDLSDLRALRQKGSTEHAALSELAGELSSEAQVLHALFALGRQRVRETALERGYAALAASEDDEDRAYKKVSHARFVARMAEDTDL